MADILHATVGLVGHGILADQVARRLSGSRQVLVHAPDGLAPRGAHIEQVDSLAALTARTTLILAAEGALDDGTLIATVTRGSTLVDLMPGDPDQARETARQLAERGVEHVDAPIHCEDLRRFPELAACLCGGSSDALAQALTVLESLGVKVIRCGGPGQGQAARSVVGAVAVCNRLITYECAAVGVANGLSVADIGAVLNRCSGANSATERVLPALVEGRESADQDLAATARELERCTRLARRVGAPVLITYQAASQVLLASRTLPAGTTLDGLRAVVERASAIDLLSTKNGGSHDRIA
jgi:3-hydroxyisobutyrate dehydrogenase